HVDRLARVRARADEAGIRRNAQLRHVAGKAQHELVRVAVVEPYRRAIGLEHVLRRLDDGGEHGREVERRGELRRHRKNRLEVARRRGAAVGAHRTPPVAMTLWYAAAL